MAQLTRTGPPATRRTRTPTAPAQPPAADSAPARRAAETAIAVALTPFTLAQQVLPRDQPVVYYGGVTAAAVAALIDWPVAAALAAGVWIARTRHVDEPPIPEG